MPPKRKTPREIEEPGTLNAEYARSYRRVLRGIVLIVALGAFIPYFVGFLFQADRAICAISGVIFVVASFALGAMLPPPEKLLRIGGEGTKRRVRMPDWSLIGYFVTIGLVSNWACAFLWFSRRYAFFSAPVIMVTGVIMALYAALALIVGLTGRNWRTALLVFLFAPGFLGLVVLRLVHFGKGF
jgi:hypothetical protein